MTLSNPNVIDATGIESHSSAVVLTIVDDMDRNDPAAHLEALCNKLNAYAHFVNSGQLSDIYKNTSISIIFIDIYPLKKYSDNILRLLESAEKSMADIGIQIRVRNTDGAE